MLDMSKMDLRLVTIQDAIEKDKARLEEIAEEIYQLSKEQATVVANINNLLVQAHELEQIVNECTE